MAFYNCLLILVTWRAKFFMKILLFLLLIRTIICFLEGLLVVIWIHGFGFRLPLMMLLIWSIFFVLRARNASLILRTSEVFVDGLMAWAYDMASFLVLAGFLASTKGLLFWKYLDMTLTSLFDFTGREGSGGTLSIVTGTGLVVSLLFLLVGGAILGENLDEIFTLSVVVLLLV